MEYDYYFSVMNEIKHLILLRGLPGSGKTTLANMLSEGKYPVFSVDDYFTGENGSYNFKFEENHLAYKKCEDNIRASMKKGESKIFVHNTCTLDWELEIYFTLAKDFDYQISVLTVENYHESENRHSISKEQIRKMAEKYKVKLF